MSYHLFTWKIETNPHISGAGDSTNTNVLGHQMPSLNTPECCEGPRKAPGAPRTTSKQGDAKVCAQSNAMQLPRSRVWKRGSGSPWFITSSTAGAQICEASQTFKNTPVLIQQGSSGSFCSTGIRAATFCCCGHCCEPSLALQQRGNGLHLHAASKNGMEEHCWAAGITAADQSWSRGEPGQEKHPAKIRGCRIGAFALPSLPQVPEDKLLGLTLCNQQTNKQIQQH